MEGLVIIGSVCQKTHDFYSDIDLIVYLENEQIDIKEKKAIRGIITKQIRSIEDDILINFDLDDKWVIYTQKNLIKLEIKIKSVSKAKEDIVFIVESRIRTPEQSIVFDKKGKIKKIYSSNWIQLNDYERIKKQFLEETNKFIYYYEGFLQKMAKDDQYSAYMNYTIAYYKLATLMAMAEGEYYNLYQPKNFPSEVVKDIDVRKRFYTSSARLSRTEMFTNKNKFVELFLDTIKKGIEEFNLDINLTQISEFIKIMESKYPSFRNLRDISLVANQCSKNSKIKEGLIFRSSSLSKYNTDLILRFLNDNNISYILDLRGINELEEYKKSKNVYDDNFLEKYVIHLPIEPKVLDYYPNDPYRNFYYGMLKDYGNQIREVFGKHFVNAHKKKFVIHCEGGKDRTGILIALLLDILGIEREYIIVDYLLSYVDTKRENIEFLFEILDNEYGGTEDYLEKYCKISNRTIEIIRDTMVIRS